jgi:molybdopterin-guanine dinucleotide biosynthesis protein A
MRSPRNRGFIGARLRALMIDTYGLILAGGLARRMGGLDKPLIAVAGRPILHWILARLSPQCAGLVLNANGEPDRFKTYAVPIVADDVAGFAGPLAGILAGLDFLARERPQAGFAVSVASDTPFIPLDLVARLHQARQAAGAEIAFAQSAGQPHPVIALWPVGLRASLRQALVGEEIRKIDRFTARHSCVGCEWQGSPYDPFFNVNTPQDVVAAETLARFVAPSA